MTRYVIATEGKPSILPDVWLDKGCLWLSEGEQVPVVDNFRWESPALGRATDLQRNEETGEVSVEIEFFDDREIDKDLYECTFWANELVEQKVEATDDEPEHRLMQSARIRGIAITPIPYHQRPRSQDLHGA